MNKELKAIKKHSISLLSHPSIMESGVYDVLFTVNGEVVEREFEVDIDADYDYECVTNCYILRYANVTATCCNEDNEDLASIMECKLEEEVENYMWG